MNSYDCKINAYVTIRHERLACLEPLTSITMLVDVDTQNAALKTKKNETND
jgi:hypothetical protein